jgi:hemerythrin superfamily protein
LLERRNDVPTIYDHLRKSHDLQRSLASAMTAARRTSEKEAAFQELAIELEAHAAAEERFLYAPTLLDDQGLSTARHALADHHELEELIEKLRTLDTGGAAWKRRAGELHKQITKHLDEEEHGMFQLTGRLLSESAKKDLARKYAADYERMKLKLSE